MILETISALIIGITAGVVTGLLPGIHINLVAVLLVSVSSLLLEITEPITLAVFIMAMTITHSFLDFIPSIFLGAPEADTALSALPGHELLLKGQGYGAVCLSLTGCYIGLAVLIIFSPLFSILLPPLYSLLAKNMAYVLIVASVFLFIHEARKIPAMLLFALSGVLGIASLNLPVEQPLFPLLSGLFGTSILIKSISDKVRVPKQKRAELHVAKKEMMRIVPAGILSSSLCSFLPGLGAAQAAVIGSETAGNVQRKGFLVLLGMISILVAGLNFTAAYAIGKPRSGVAVAAVQILGAIGLQELFILLATAVAAGSVSFFLGKYFAGIFAENISRIEYSKLSAVILAGITALTFLFSGFLGFIILITATAIGLTAHYAGIRKMHLMGCLLVPVILYFL